MSLLWIIRLRIGLESTVLVVVLPNLFNNHKLSCISRLEEAFAWSTVLEDLADLTCPTAKAGLVAAKLC